MYRGYVQCARNVRGAAVAQRCMDMDMGGVRFA